MTVKPDRWIRRMALEHKMIEPFEDRQVRDGVISYGVSSYGDGIRVAEAFRPAIVCGVQWSREHHSAEFVRAGALGGILSHPAERADDLRGEIHVRAMRNYCERDAVRAGVGRIRDAR